MKNLYASEMSPVITEPLAALLRQSSVLRTLRTGDTQQNQHGGEMTESIFPRPSALSYEELSDLVAEHSPVFMDDEYAFYKVDGVLYVAPVEYVYDTAVREAGFATEPLRHLLHELYCLLYLRMLEDPVKGFTHHEWEICAEVRKELGLKQAYRGE